MARQPARSGGGGGAGDSCPDGYEWDSDIQQCVIQLDGVNDGESGDGSDSGSGGFDGDTGGFGGDDYEQDQEESRQVGGSGDPTDEPEPADTSLLSIGTTAFNLSTGDRATLNARVTNDGGEAANVTVRWFFGGTQVAATETNVQPGQTERVEESVTYDHVMNRKGAGDHEYGAHIRGDGTSGESTDYGTMHVQPRPTDNEGESGDESGDESDETPPSEPAGLLPEGFPTLPALGPLSAEQTTAAAVGAVLLVVVLR